MFVFAFLWSEIKSTFIKAQKELGPYQRRIQGRGPGAPLLMFRAKWGPNGREIWFWRPPPLSQSLDDCPPPPPPPYLKVWICHYISCHLDRTSLVNKRFVTWPKRKGFWKTSGRERQVHLSSSGSQSEHRICLTLPAGRVSHIQLIIHLIISSVRQATC